MLTPDGLSSRLSGGRVPAAELLMEGLAGARRVRLRVRSVSGRTVVRGRGEATSRAGPEDAIIVHERGVWRNAQGVRARFTNASRWTPGPNGVIRLEHLRRSEADPVRLVDLVSSNGSTWRSQAPHVCGADRYTATVHVDAHGVRLRWRIRGPRKAMIVETAYRR